MDKLTTPSPTTAHIREHKERGGFLRADPVLIRDGFDLSSGAVSNTWRRLNVGEFETPDDMADDPDLGVLRNLHKRAGDEHRALAETLAAVYADDDPALNTAGRVKLAARLVTPKLEELAAVATRELDQVDARIGQEEAELAKSLKPTDPATGALHSDIRGYWLAESQKPSTTRSLISPIITGEIDDDTLFAVATAPAYMSGISPRLHEQARELLAQRLAPDRARRITALKVGKQRAVMALSALDGVVKRLVDFKRAEELSAKERKHG